MPEKELHFFNQYDRPEKEVEHYRKKFFGWSGQVHVGEKTPNYSLISDGPRKIGSVIPEVKLIWSFRNPADRAYSNYWHAVKRGWEFRSFEAALAKEDEILNRSKAKVKPGRCYATRSEYVGQIRRFLEIFDRKQMHFVLFEDLVSSPVETVQGVMDFLGVDEPVVERPDRHKHQTRLPKVRFVEYLAHKTLGGTRLGNTVTWLNKKRDPGYPEMPCSNRKKLDERFQTWYPEFEQLTGLSTSRWIDAQTT